jgi:negative regulator of sigma E activity
MAEETQPTHVKVTMNDLYREQQETNRMLVKTVAHLEQLADLPDRMRAVELKQAKTEWIEKVAYAGLTASIVALVGLIVGVVNV